MAVVHAPELTAGGQDTCRRGKEFVRNARMDRGPYVERRVQEDQFRRLRRKGAQGVVADSRRCAPLRPLAAAVAAVEATAAADWSVAVTVMSGPGLGQRCGNGAVAAPRSMAQRASGRIWGRKSSRKRVPTINLAAAKGGAVGAQPQVKVGVEFPAREARAAPLC